MLRLLALPVAALALFVAACGGGSDTTAAPADAPDVQESTAEGGRPGETKATGGMTNDPEPGETLLRFVDAAGAGDADALWELLSVESQERLGPREKFDAEYVDRFREGVGTFAGTDPAVVVTGSDETDWGIAAIAGTREREGETEFAAYGAALRRDGEEWRLELGAPIKLARIEGTPAGTLEVEVSADAEVLAAGLWIDGQPLWATVVGDDADTFVVHAERLELEGDRHVGVAFARTGSSATAGAFPLPAEPAMPTTTA